MHYFFLWSARLFLAFVGMLGVLMGLPFAAWAVTSASVDLERDLNAHLFISNTDQTGLDIKGDMTIEAWVKPESAPPIGESYAIVSKSAGDVNDAGFDFLYQTGSFGGQFTFAVSANGFSGTYCTIQHTLPLNEWHHAAVVYDASAGSCEVFVNGTSAGSSGGLDASIHNNSAPLRIGARGHTPMFFFDGLIDDVRVWNIAKDATEITAHYRTEIIGSEAGLVGYWKLNGNLLDASIQGNHLTASGDIALSPDTPFLNEPEDDSGAWMVRQSDRAVIDVATPALPAKPHDDVLRATRAAPAAPARDVACVDDQCYHNKNHD